MLRDVNCIPVQDKDGNVSTYKCDGPLGEKMKQGKFENLGTQKVKKMELEQGNERKTPLTFTSDKLLSYFAA